MYERLPQHLRARAVTHSNETRWILSNGSRALAFSTRSGRSYTGTLALVDEADFVPELSQFLNAVKPTIDAGGQLFLVSTSDKKRPISTFKNLFRAAVQGTGDYRHIFLPWWARPGPGRGVARIGAGGDVRPAGDARRLLCRVPGVGGGGAGGGAAGPAAAVGVGEGVRRGGRGAAGRSRTSGRCGASRKCPPLPGLTVWEEPIPGRRYVIGADPAEGNPNSDESAACVLDAESWAQVAELTGKIEPSTFAGYLDELGRWYNGADVMAERNNHGHLLIRELQRLGNLRVLAGYDGKPGWLSNVKGKPLLYGLLADAVRDGACVIRGSETAAQLAASRRRRCGRRRGCTMTGRMRLRWRWRRWRGSRRSEPSTMVVQADPLAAYDRGSW